MDGKRHDIELPLVKMAASTDPLEARKGSRLLELVQYLQAQGDAPAAGGCFRLGRLWLVSSDPANKVSITVWLDWQDYGPLREALPEMHYRLQIQRPDTKLSTDARVANPAEVEQIIWQAFGWSR
jgi:hypothetical protein